MYIREGDFFSFLSIFYALSTTLSLLLVLCRLFLFVHHSTLLYHSNIEFNKIKCSVLVKNTIFLWKAQKSLDSMIDRKYTEACLIMLYKEIKINVGL